MEHLLHSFVFLENKIVNAKPLLNKDIYIELLLLVLSFDKKMKRELNKGKNIKVDNIGKFILL